MIVRFLKETYSKMINVIASTNWLSFIVINLVLFGLFSIFYYFIEDYNWVLIGYIFFQSLFSYSYVHKKKKYYKELSISLVVQGILYIILIR